MGLFDRFKKTEKSDSSDREEIIEKTFNELNANLKKASIAQIGGFRPSGDPLVSKFSGDFVMKSDENWPVHNGKPLQAFLQVRISDLPFVPDQLTDFDLITVFVDQNELPFDQPNGQGWLIRTYKSLDGLELKENPIKDTHIKPFEIQWSLAENEGPNWEDAWSVSDLTDFNKLDNSSDLFYDNYKNHYFTKIGGWPSLVQHELNMGPENFVFQIGSEEKANWSWVDAGTAYFGIKDGQWLFECQFY